MTKVIVLSTVLGLSALGMACGDAGTNVNVNAKPANNTAVMNASTPAPVSTPMATPMASPMASPMNTNGSMKPNTNMSPSNMKPSNSPAPSPTKKP